MEQFILVISIEKDHGYIELHADFLDSHLSCSSSSQSVAKKVFVVVICQEESIKITSQNTLEEQVVELCKFVEELPGLEKSSEGKQKVEELLSQEPKLLLIDFADIFYRNSKLGRAVGTKHHIPILSEAPV